jgi:hypothetical protein
MTALARQEPAGFLRVNDLAPTFVGYQEETQGQKLN